MAKSKPEPADAGTSKMAMVEAALDALGDAAAPADIQPWVKDQYKTDIGRPMISSYASQLRKRRGGGASGAVKVSGGGGAVGVKDIALLKDLIDKVGAAELAGLIKVLSK